MEWPPWYNHSDTLQFHPLHPNQPILTKIPLFDHLFHGLFPGQIFEITGQAGSGKTNLALEISKNICEENECYYLSTLKPLSASRLSSIGLNLDNFYNKYSSDLPNTLKLITKDLFQVAQQRKLKLFVLDNIYTLAQDEQINNNEKLDLVHRIAIIIKELSYSCEFGVILINNVVSDMAGGIRPGLGVNWSYCVNHRVMLSKIRDRREVRVEFSNTCEEGVIGYLTISSGKTTLANYEEDFKENH